MIQILLMISMPGPFEWVLILGAVFWIYTIYKVVTATFKESGQKFTWTLIVVLLGAIGAIIFWTVGRRYVTKPVNTLQKDRNV